MYRPDNFIKYNYKLAKKKPHHFIVMSNFAMLVEGCQHLLSHVQTIKQVQLFSQKQFHYMFIVHIWEIIESSLSEIIIVYIEYYLLS